MRSIDRAQRRGATERGGDIFCRTIAPTMIDKPHSTREFTMLLVLVGARGAGKTTLAKTLHGAGITVLKPTTTRAPRFPGEDEYDFVNRWTDSKYAWKIGSGPFYGMRKSEVDKAASQTCVTVFDPIHLNVFESVRRSLGTETMTIGLNTIADLNEQHARVNNDPKRLMNQDEFDEVLKIVSECDVVLSGKESVVSEAMESLVKLISGRGGVVTKSYLTPLMKAGALLTGADISRIQSASYDLRVGKEILCQGNLIELSPTNPRFEIPPYSYAIVSALEYASLPPCVIGRFDLKVSFFFEGVILSNGPQVDPGYKGALFCMLYNGSGQPKLLTLGKHFATIDFTTTTSVTEGYKQKYQLKQKMDQFLTDSAATGSGGEIVGLIDRKIGHVDQKVRNIQFNFWAITAAFLTLAVAAPALTIPIAWIEIDKLRTERLAMEEAQKKASDMLLAAAKERSDLKSLIQPGIRRQQEHPASTAPK